VPASVSGHLELWRAEHKGSSALRVAVSAPILAARFEKGLKVVIEESRTSRQVAGDQLPGRDPVIYCAGGHSEYFGDMADRIGGLEWQIPYSQNLF
jgi:hypothetical protein